MDAVHHYQRAEQLADKAEDWADADYGWAAGLTQQERQQFRMADLAAAQLHATLAGVAVAMLTAASGGTAPESVIPEWVKTAKGDNG